MVSPVEQNLLAQDVVSWTPERLRPPSLHTLSEDHKRREGHQTRQMSHPRRPIPGTKKPACHPQRGAVPACEEDGDEASLPRHRDPHRAPS